MHCHVLSWPPCASHICHRRSRHDAVPSPAVPPRASQTGRGLCRHRLSLPGGARTAALERRLGLNSRHSGKPPSSEGLAKPAVMRRTRSLREKTGRKPEGRAGRKGETLRRAAHPNRVKDHIPVCCRGCGPSLSGAAPAVRPSGTPRFGDGRRCGRCGAVTQAGFPVGVPAPAQYGPRLAALAPPAPTHLSPTCRADTLCHSLHAAVRMCHRRSGHEAVRSPARFRAGWGPVAAVGAPFPAGSGRPVSAHIACAPGRARIAAARNARLIARARQAADAALPSVSRGVFFRAGAGARRSGLRMPLAPVPPYH